MPAGVSAGLAAGSVVVAVGTSHPARMLADSHALVPSLEAVRLQASPKYGAMDGGQFAASRLPRAHGPGGLSERTVSRGSQNLPNVAGVRGLIVSRADPPRKSRDIDWETARRRESAVQSGVEVRMSCCLENARF